MEPEYGLKPFSVMFEKIFLLKLRDILQVVSSPRISLKQPKSGRLASWESPSPHIVHHMAIIIYIGSQA